jgi:uncharacterized membrane protein YjdF
MNLGQVKFHFSDRVQMLIIQTLRTSIIIGALLAVFFNAWELVFMSVLTYGLSYIPSLIERKYKVDLPVQFEIAIVAFIYGAIFLGEAGNFYEKIWWWDDMLHTVSGVILGFAGFLMLYTLYYQKKLQTTPKMLSFFAVCFAVAAGAVWEIFEYAMDQLFGLNMQKSGLPDTMGDLIVDLIGAILVATAGYFYITRGREGIISGYINKFLDQNQRIKRGIKNLR